MKAKRYQEGRVYEEVQVPADYEPLRALEATEATLRRFIADLCQRSEVRRIRCKKRMFVHKDDIVMARGILAKRTSNKSESHDDQPVLFSDDLRNQKAQLSESARPSAVAIVALCRIDTCLTMMQETLERLTAAVESIATQPKADAVANWRDMNGESH